VRRLLPAALLLAACASRTPPTSAEDARSQNEETLTARAAELDSPKNARRYVVVQNGAVAAIASLPDDAVRAARAKSAAVRHRFVFRPVDRGERLWRMAYVAQGGVVAGRRFLDDLGLEAVGPPGRPPLLRRRGGAGGLDLAKTPLRLELSTLEGAAAETVDAAYDPDFDGTLLLPRDVATRLSLELYEIPGAADVQVALGRPFRARRATVLAKVAGFLAAGPIEVVFETTPAKK
jgi:hypothetical protein